MAGPYKTLRQKVVSSGKEQHWSSMSIAECVAPHPWLLETLAGALEHQHFHFAPVVISNYRNQHRRCLLVGGLVQLCSDSGIDVELEPLGNRECL